MKIMMLMMIEGNKGNMSIMWGERKKEKKKNISKIIACELDCQ